MNANNSSAVKVFIINSGLLHALAQALANKR